MRNILETRTVLAAVAALVLLLPAGSAQAQDTTIRSLVINVLDPETKEVLAEVSPGETLTLEVGSKVRLRMVAIPGGQHRGPRYPSTRFELVSGKGRVNVTAANEEVGNVTLVAVRPDNPQRPNERTIIHFEILENWPMAPKLDRGSLEIEVVGSRPQVTPPTLRRGVVLYDQTGFRGYSETLVESDPHLADNPIRNDSVSSIRVAPGCEAVLFEDANYRGRQVRITRDTDDLSYSGIGNRAASSIQVTCRQGGFGGDHGGRRGATLYADDEFRGRQEKFYGDDYDLGDNPIRNDSASSLRVDRGCRATLYTDAEFRGRSYTFYEDVRNLARTPIGNDSVSSVRIECE